MIITLEQFYVILGMNIGIMVSILVILLDRIEVVK